MKHILRFCLIATALIVFVNCSNSTKILPKKVQNIVVTKNESNSIVLYFDSNGRLSELKDQYDHCVYQYFKDSIISIHNGDTTFDYGKIQKGRIIEYPPFDFSYTPDGYFKAFGEGIYVSNTVENGKITRAKFLDNDLTFLYKKDIQNNISVDFSYLYFCLDDWRPLSGFLFSGLMGKRTEYLPTEIYKDNELLVRYTYEFDGEYLTKIIMNDKMNYRRSEVIFEIYYE